MKWFILVLFFNQGDPYIFTKPTFDSEDQCIGSITDPQFYPTLVEKLIQDYEGRMEKIEHVFCIDKNQLKILLEYRNTQDV
jgi:hypothetical protein